jgi:hypothetical protein
METQALFRKAKDGDKDAVFELQDRFNDIHFPGMYLCACFCRKGFLA